jgi:tetratricopeptide (TPR) repeat protein
VAEGKPTAADSLFEEIVRTLNESVGSESPDMLRALAALGGKAYREQRSDDALPLLNRAVDGYRRLNYNIGADHQGALNVLVTIYTARGEHQKAVQTQREIVALNTASLGIDDISTLNAVQALAWVLKQGGSNDEARELYRDVTQRYQSVVGLSHVGTLHVMIELAALECEVDPAEALRIARLATELATPLATSSQYPLRARIVLGRALLASGGLEEAEVTLRNAVEACTRERSASHIYTKEAASLLARVLDQTARYEAARLLRQEYELKPEVGP